MIRKISSPFPKYVRVVFEFPASIWADRVYLVGDFNNWNEQATPFQQDREGVWQAVLDLPAGQRYEFRYLVDGEWHTDYHADGFATSMYGAHNSVVETTLPATAEGTNPALDAKPRPAQPAPRQIGSKRAASGKRAVA